MGMRVQNPPHQWVMTIGAKRESPPPQQLRHRLLHRKAAPLTRPKNVNSIQQDKLLKRNNFVVSGKLMLLAS
jgi:hypothetical protein